MIETKLPQIERPDDPNRCQSMVKYGQCRNLKVENTNHCLRHGGATAQHSYQKEMTKKYKLAQWQARTSEFSDDDQIKSLREEIGILRMTLEQVIRQCHTAMDLVLWSTKIGVLVTQIEKLVVSCNRLEASTGLLLDKSAALSLASQMVEIISRYVTNPSAIDQISTEIATIIVQLNGDDE